MFSCILFYLSAFGTVWLPYSVQNRQNWCKSSCHEVALECFATNATDLAHWTLNSCFCAFHTIWVHLGSFGCVTTLSLKWVKLVEKFVTRSRVRIFHNERTRPTPMDPKLIFLCISYYFSAVGTVWLLFSVQNGQNWCKSSCHEVASEFFATNLTDPPPLDPKLMFLCLSYYLGAFGTVWLCYNT